MEKIILDCDPGHDDAVAILMAGIHPSIELLGITTVAGNQTLNKTTINALNVCQYLNIDVPVCSGMSLPMVRKVQTIADDIHGESGLDGPVFDKLTKELDKRHAVNFIIETLKNSNEKITLVITGPMTNVAMAFRMDPSIIEKVKRIILMGGSYQLGNVTPAAEFNIFADAEAAYVVFNSGVPLVMMGLDLTRQALCYPSIVERMGKIGGNASKLFVDLMGFFCKTQKQVFGWEGGPLHDPTCIAYLIDESCIETKDMYSEVEIRSEKCYGRTLCDYFGVTKNKPNSKVSIKLDIEKFWNIVEECIKLYNK
ncbi:nucleoside hydrolase [Brachyspira murdochii]|uniref:Ribosylpyrimidine nucleosidase n=1 Tax=Brachyspira murdochii (strain ATCC 51284 / DSM 12563 / 56-150) TaxID=526224 RepID=D5U411_BRAM5|nr:nucleoside hydrolase [Brachyspira murdochii]ADG72192.1 Ribosylpyrimidine nucleosidase [Brachyspira murdochii DSM 12563]